MDAITKLESEGVRTIERLHQSEVEWEEIIKTNDMTLRPLATAVGRGMEATFPGKKAEPMAYISGMDNNEEQRRATTSIDGWKRFQSRGRERQRCSV